MREASPTPEGPVLAAADAVPATHGGVPFSPRFGDVYHAHIGALAQAQHVFLQGNGLPERWRGRDAFTVAETGFGLGLNFLALWQAWREDSARCARLHVLSVEAYPFTQDDLTRWLGAIVPPALQGLADALIAAWPLPLPGQHRLVFEGGAVSLTLCLGQAQTMVPQWQAAVNAYFLDGFSPARNPQMWSPALMQALAAHAAPGATAATWTSAGAVRRALTEAGFAVRKVPGFAGKRDMTVGRHAEGGALGRAVLAHARRPGTALVIGAGVAGAGAADALAQAGWSVRVLACAAPHEAGHVAAALTPQVDREDSVRSRLARAGALAAARRWAPTEVLISLVLIIWMLMPSCDSVWNIR
ncbi:tRNA (5-methylaminomethyl-2-thiouridine)(34)-methyltransferase MnmD, partial [Achromobacter sp. GG226]|nr:tRNA (5-methylaminomethyl-2-thiouridine)(34)-methyltransferase MnmD [Verticiella sp. GG226]